MGMLKGLLPKYFSSEWSFAQWKCDSPEALVAFSPTGQSCIYVLSTACSFSKLSFDAASGRIPAAFGFCIPSLAPLPLLLPPPPPAWFALMPRRRQHHRHVQHQNSGRQGGLSALAPPTAVPPAECGTGNM
jgi:hypothetical protein